MLHSESEVTKIFSCYELLESDGEVVERLVDVADAAVEVADHAVELGVGCSVDVALQEGDGVVQLLFLLEDLGQQVGGRQEVRVLAERLLQRRLRLHQQPWFVHQNLCVQLQHHVIN